MPIILPALKRHLALCLGVCFCATLYGQGDDPCSATIITPTDGTTCTPTHYSLAGLTSTAAGAATNPTCASFNPGITPDGWFRFTTTTSKNIFITTTAGSIYDGGMELYVQTGANCASIASIICDDDSDPGPGFMPQISLLNQPAGTYFIRFWDFEDTPGDFNLCVATTASGDDPCSALSIIPATGTTCTPGNYSLVGLTSTSSAAATNPTCAGFNPGVTPDGWLTFTTTSLQDIFITTTAGSIYDGGMELYVQTGGSCTTLQSVICDDDSDPGPGFMPQINVLRQPAGTYYLRFWDFEDTPGDLNLCVATITPIPANDNCTDAMAFPTIPTDGINCATVTANTFRATGSADATCTGAEDDDLWYTFTLPTGYSAVIYNMTTISGSNDRVIQLFDGSCPGTSLGCFGAESGFITGLTGGTTYLMRVYTAGSGVVSNFDICLMLPPVNDDCSNAIPITNASGVFIDPGTQYAGIATPSLPPITCNGKTSPSANDVWYKFQPDANGGNVAISITPTGSADLVIEGFMNAGNCSGPSFCADATLDGTETLEMTNLSLHGNGSADHAGTYYFRVYRYGSAAPYSFNISASGTALPLVLKSFTGQVADKINVLHWETLTEKNVQFHVVERSVDGLHWRAIGRKNGLVNSSVPVKYTLQDRAPLAKGYYRLRSADFDGLESRSNSILLVRQGESFGIVSIFPSPAADKMTVQCNTAREENVTLRIMDMTGRLVLTQIAEARKGMNELPIAVQGLQPGLYTVTMSNSTDLSTPLRFVKQ